jgi:Zn-finger nucleic acid-binding protein
MESEHMNIVQLELKYCERCGGLWVRRLESEEVYCASCAVEMADCASAGRRKSSPRLPGNHKSEGFPAPKLVLISQEGGNA